LGTAWIEWFCIHGPGDIHGRPLRADLPDAIPLSDELSKLTADCYALGEDGRRLYDSVFYSRPKGADKSGHAARIGLFEAMGPCRFRGFAEGPRVHKWGSVKGERYEQQDFVYEYQAGEPMGAPVTDPFLRILATEEGQTGNVYDAIYVILREGPLLETFRREEDIGLTRVFLPGGGEIRPSTASSSAKDGGKETWTDFDETHLYTTPELKRMYWTVRRNLRKRRIAQPWSFESSTMYMPGKDSIAEVTHTLAKEIREGKRKVARLLFDHREAPADTDLNDEASLRAGLREAYGDAASYMDIDGLIAEIWGGADAADSRRFFLNQVTADTFAWVTPQEWDALKREVEPLRAGELITLGVDGSRTRDHTALVAERVEDGQFFTLGKWDPKEHATRDDPVGQVPLDQVDAEVRKAYAEYDVVGHYSDVRELESYIDSWEQDFGDQLCARSTNLHPIAWDMRRQIEATKMAEELHAAILEADDIGHDGDKGDSQYVYNAKRWTNRLGVTFGKETPMSEAKVDWLAAAALARKARRDYLALPPEKQRQRKGPSVYETRGVRRI
jgi:hypothetical protein